MFRRDNFTSLPVLPADLTELYCSHNRLTSLPTLPANLIGLDCSYNQISSLPSLNNKVYFLHLDSNVNLSCIPSHDFIGSYYDFSITNTKINCLLNVIQHPNYRVPMLDTRVVCGIFNPNGCQVAWNIKGSIAKDADGSCSTTGDGAIVENVSVQLLDSVNNLLQQVYVSAAGNYSFDTHLGTYNVRGFTYYRFAFHRIMPSGDVHTDTLTQADSLDYNANFRLYCKPGYDLGVNAISSGNSFFPGHKITLWVHAGDEAIFYGVNCNSAGLGGTVTANVSGPVTILSASTSSNASSVVNGNNITWTVTDFSQVDFNNTFNCTVHTDISAKSGDQVCVSTTISAAGSDNNLRNTI